jgi:hypothetical protein
MRRNLLLASAAFACLVGSAAMVGSSCNGNTPNKRANGTLTLNASDTIFLGGANYTSWRDSVAGDPSQHKGGGYWVGTYSGPVRKLRFGSFLITHEAQGSTFWAGFTTGSNGDKACYGVPCPSGGCDSTYSYPWLDNQWGVTAGGGISSTSPITATKGYPYLIAYWNYWADEHESRRTLEVSLPNNALFAPQEVYICNHPWPYCGNIYGDGFARPFKKGDYFHLYIHAVKYDGRKDSVTHVLARFPTTQLIQSPDWQRVDLTQLFKKDNDSIKSIYFTMYSTDSDPQWGPNTAVYFNMDKLKVIKQDGTATSLAVQRATAATPKAVEVKDYFPLTSYTGGEVTVHDANTGDVVHKTTVKAGEKPDLSKLPAGEYRLRHGHRHIPIKKLK